MRNVQRSHAECSQITSFSKLGCAYCLRAERSSIHLQEVDRQALSPERSVVIHLRANRRGPTRAQDAGRRAESFNALLRRAFLCGEVSQ